MILSMPQQAWLFLSTVIIGAGLGLFYDVFRVLRKTAPHRSFAVQFEDLLFWLAVTALVFYFMLHSNYGEIRFFSLLGIAIGGILYFATISRPVLKVSVAVVNFLKRVIAATLRIILLPLRLIVAWLKPPVKKLLHAIRKRLRSWMRCGKIRARKTARSWSIVRKKV